MDSKDIKLYGADWCAKTALLRNYLQSEWIDFEYFNVELDETAAERVRSFYEGKLKFPTLTIGEQHYKNPKISELRKALQDAGLL